MFLSRLEMFYGSFLQYEYANAENGGFIMSGKKISGIALSICMILNCAVWPSETVNAADNGVIRDLTTMELIDDMGLGINLGNTFESCGDWIAQWGDGTPNAYETAWGSPTVTQAMVQGYADEGFDTLRIPVAWSNMMSTDGSYTISDAYMERVHEVVDWALDAEMYVIVNLHYDSGWMNDLPSQYDTCMEKYSTIWTQVCEEFKDYSDYLIFESQNEELGWSTIDETTSYNYVNEVNQTFVDIVRNSGGNNGQRHLLISGVNTDISKTCDSRFKMPSDPVNRCAVSVHYYTPATFCILEEDASWGKASSTWGTSAEIAELNANFDKLVSRFTSQGIPVIVGEYGCPKKNKEEDSVRKFLSSVCEASLSRGGICPVLWDITDLHYNRSTYQMNDSQLQSQLAEIRETYLPEDQKPTVIEPLNGNLVSNLTVKDTTYYQSWAIDTDLAVGDQVFGDRTVEKAAFSVIPEALLHSELILTPCDAKNSSVEQAVFTAAEDITVYAGFDSRIESVPAWASDWTEETMTVQTSNDVTFKLYSRQVNAGETVSLGSNGQSASVMNYIVIAAKQTENPIEIQGDANADGSFSVADVVMLQRWLLCAGEITDWQAADLCKDNKLDVYDLCVMKKMLILK